MFANLKGTVGAMESPDMYAYLLTRITTGTFVSSPRVSRDTLGLILNTDEGRGPSAGQVL